jgi:uncharacterized membrane protein YebE (DUF533 family)
MTKQTKTLLGLAAVAGVGYYAYTQWKKSQPTTTTAKAGFANALGSGGMGMSFRGCPCQQIAQKDYPAKGWNTCAGGQACPAQGPYQPY